MVTQIKIFQISSTVSPRFYSLFLPVGEKKVLSPHFRKYAHTNFCNNGGFLHIGAHFCGASVLPPVTFVSLVQALTYSIKRCIRLVGGEVLHFLNVEMALDFYVRQ